MTGTGVVAVWSGEEGWGVVESADTPGGCWVHVGMLWAITLPPTREHETVNITGSSVDLVEGETVDFEWEQVPQDGYDYRAISVRPRRDGPTRTIRWEYGRDRHPGFVMRVVPRPQ
jgi:CspA family cold shock protein